MNAPRSFAEPNAAEIGLQIRHLRNTIALERQKVTAITISVKRHETRLRQLEAQHALAGVQAQPALAMLGR